MLYRQSWWEQARTCAVRLAGSRQNVACNIKAWCVARSSAISAVLVAFLLTRVTIGAVIAVSLVYIKLDPTMPVPQGAPPILWGLLRWDSLHLAHIVQYGYDRGRTPFFPLYPLLVKGLSLLVGNVFVAGLLLSHVALVVALFYLYALAQDMYDAATARRAVFYLATAPAAVFFSAMYKESLFVALATATLYHARKSVSTNPRPFHLTFWLTTRSVVAKKDAILRPPAVARRAALARAQSPNARDGTMAVCASS